MDRPDELIPANERRVRQGGLMRCCLATIGNSTELSKAGTTLSCEFESDDPDNQKMIVGDDGIWEWNRP